MGGSKLPYLVRNALRLKCVERIWYRGIPEKGGPSTAEGPPLFFQQPLQASLRWD